MTTHACMACTVKSVQRTLAATLEADLRNKQRELQDLEERQQIEQPAQDVQRDPIDVM